MSLPNSFSSRCETSSSPSNHFMTSQRCSARSRPNGGKRRSLPRAARATKNWLVRTRGKALFMQRQCKSFVSSVPTVANQRMPTSPALILHKVESLLLRHCTNVRSEETIYLKQVGLRDHLFLSVSWREIRTAVRNRGTNKTSRIRMVATTINFFQMGSPSSTDRDVFSYPRWLITS
jgi:hypothetical protein